MMFFNGKTFIDKLKLVNIDSSKISEINFDKQ
jgi:hypothetical protein